MLNTTTGTRYVKCNLCGQDNTDLFFDNGYNCRIVKCRNCGLLYHNPQVVTTKEAYSADYYKDYYAIYEPQKDKPSDYIQGYEPKRDLEIIAQLKKRKPTGRVLEVGCCFGLFLKSARQVGYETKGVEISDYAGSYARDVLSLDIFIGQLQEANFPDNHFDIIYMSQLLEHLTDPLSTLREVYRILKKDGILFLEVPNEYHSLSGVLRIMRFKERRPAVSAPFHLYYFSPRTVRAILKKAGFKIVNKYITYSLVVDITGSVEGLFGKWAAQRLRRHQKVERLISSFIRKFTAAFDLGLVMRIYAVKDENSNELTS